MGKHDHCPELLNFLSDYVDGALQDELCAEIDRHLEGCENCRIVVDTLRKTIYLYQATSADPTLPGDVRQRLYHCLDLDDFLGL